MALGQADAAAGGGVTGNLAGMQADGSIEAQEIRHRHTFELGAGRASAFANVDVFLHDPAVSDVVAVER